jgi:hypothetical protein
LDIQNLFVSLQPYLGNNNKNNKDTHHGLQFQRNRTEMAEAMGGEWHLSRSGG